MGDIERFCLNYKDTMRNLNYIEEMLKSPLVDSIPWLKLVVSANKIFFKECLLKELIKIYILHHWNKALLITLINLINLPKILKSWLRNSLKSLNKLSYLYKLIFIYTKERGTCITGLIILLTGTLVWQKYALRFMVYITPFCK